MLEVEERSRWEPCVAHRSADVDKFVASHFTQPDREIFLVAGAGFDPRSRTLADRLGKANIDVRALFIREKRRGYSQIQLDRAEANAAALIRSIPNAQVRFVDVFALDGSVVGGLNAVRLLSQQNLLCVTDVIVDVSALSAGVSFPIIRFLLSRVRANLHVFVVHAPFLDDKISPIVSDKARYVHGFMGRATLSTKSDAARLWLPQLATGMKRPLQLLFDFVRPDDTCPILPFPAHDPRFGDRLAEEYLAEIEDTWSVDARNIVYGDESDPLDIYRTILRLDKLREPVFAETGGSMLILSPLGSKLMALGAMMAALDRDLPVAYVEAIDYEVRRTMPETIDQPDLIHLWLKGDVYLSSRPDLPSTTQ